LLQKQFHPCNKKGKKEKSSPLENSNDNVNNVAKHGLARKNRLMKLGGQQVLEHIKKLTKNLQLQFSSKSDSWQSKSVQRSKQNKPSKHERELQSKCIQEKLQTLGSHAHKLQGCPKIGGRNWSSKK